MKVRSIHKRSFKQFWATYFVWYIKCQEGLARIQFRKYSGAKPTKFRKLK